MSSKDGNRSTVAGRIAVVAVRPASGEVGGAERLYEGLAQALEAAGNEVDLLQIVSEERSFETIQESYLRFYDLDLSRYARVVSTKAPSYAVRHPNHVCYLLHTMRVFYDMFEVEFPEPTPELLQQRKWIHELDTCCLSPPYTRAIFSNGQEVRDRLRSYNGLDAIVLHHDTFGLLRAEACPEPVANRESPFIFMPGRLHRWKRVQLVIKAMKFVDAPIELKIAGSGEDEGWLQELAASDSRITFVGAVSDQELVNLYQQALVVPFVPQREDFGLITLEAFRCSKPVITCEDSGEPTRLVRDGWSGFICPPLAKAVAEKLQHLIDHPETAREMGRRGHASVAHISWERVSQTVLDSLSFGRPP